jgi:hypothetical protein
MCTVTYLPYNQGFILTHNRDEAPTRSPKVISEETILGDHLFFPKDTKAGGTWIVTSQQGKTACLLNGAFLKHQHQPPYRRSRGLMLLDFFAWDDPYAFFENYDFQGIEPFTFLFFQTNTAMELRWDGDQRFLRNLDPQSSHFWCSATLYPPEMQRVREKVFQDWLEVHPIAAPDILQLHHHGSVGDPHHDFVMNRAEKVRTVSITQVVKEAQLVTMEYEDLLELGGEKQIKKINLETGNFPPHPIG